MILLASQSVDNLVYFNANKSANLELYVAPALTVAAESNTPTAKTKS